MNAVFDDYRRIVRVVMAQRDARSRTVVVVLAAVFALAVVMGTLIAAVHHKLELGDWLRVAFGLGGFWLAFVWVIFFMPGSVLLNSPVNARLLPRQRRRLIQMAAAGWLFCAVAFAVVMDSWTALPLGGLYLIGVLLILAGHREAIVPIMAACYWPWLRGVLPQPLVETLSSGPSVLVLSLLLLPAGAWALRLLYPVGGDAHLDKRGDQLKRIQRFTARGTSDRSEIGGPAGKGILRVYAVALRRDCRRAEPARMLMHALGPAAHWSAWLGAMVALPSGVIGLRLLMAWHASSGMDRALDVAASVCLGTLAAIVVFCTAQFGQQLRRTRGEQALLRLTPLAGDGALLNRRLASQLLKDGLRNWGMMTGCILLVTLLFSGDGATLLRQFALCCLAGQVAMMGLLGDYARDGGWNLMLALGAAVLAAFEAGVAVGLGRLAGTTAWPWLVAIALPGAVIQLRRSWRAMLAAPCAFPAGRLA